LRTKGITKPKHKEPETSIHIIDISSNNNGNCICDVRRPIVIDGMMKQYSACRDNIIGYEQSEQSGIYKGPEEFRLALTSCDSK
jgi:hypothetical protein